ELKFINSIKEFYAQECKKYWERYYRYQHKKNINNLFDSPRLLIIPYDSELNNKYISFFENNHDEFETYYGREFDLDDLKYCNQEIRPLSFALIEKDTNEYIGSIALDLLRSDCVYNIEYYIFPTYRKYGYAKEALTRIIEVAKNKELKVLEETIRVGVYAEEYLNIKCIEARTSTENIASISLLKKCGFELMGKLPYDKKINDIYIDSVQYDLII
ncbi:MAG: GNAT family N-acetyltransferase, partial [Clostridia bacterium]|nr:GNAT family N-acetyltransferase [Clostridia bacterium]